GHWPTAGDLAAEEVPPFATDPLDKEKRAWSSREDVNGVNYLGWDQQQPALTAFLALVQEPGETAPLGAVLDEEHHQLANGDLLHVSRWMKTPGGPIPEGGILDPKLSGWTQLGIAEPR